MTLERFFDCYSLGALLCLVCLGIARGAMQYARGVRVVVADRQRSISEILVDLLFLACLGLWVYEIVAYAWTPPGHPIQGWMGVVLLSSTVSKGLGALSALAGLLVYAAALWVFGDSWRLGIDREMPGALVTHGIFARTRNPVYLGLDLLFMGTFLLNGRLVFLLLALALLAMIHSHIRREERFLAETHGEAYREYCARVGRYVTLR
jgi:protein-S-isoprenylcysteine O-methyltransferase Ste14